MVKGEHIIISDKRKGTIRQKSKWVDGDAPVSAEELARSMDVYTPLQKCAHRDGYSLFYSIGTKDSSTPKGEPVKTLVVFYRTSREDGKPLTPEQTDGLTVVLETLLDGLCNANLERHRCQVNGFAAGAPNYLIEELANRS